MSILSSIQTFIILIKAWSTLYSLVKECLRQPSPSNKWWWNICSRTFDNTDVQTIMPSNSFFSIIFFTVQTYFVSSNNADQNQVCQPKRGHVFFRSSAIRWSSVKSHFYAKFLLDLKRAVNFTTLLHSARLPSPNDVQSSAFNHPVRHFSRRFCRCLRGIKEDAGGDQQGPTVI